MFTDSRTTRLLVSVRTAAEAKLVDQLPVAIIDVKEPKRGSLGCPSPATLRSVRRTVGGDHALSAALGELIEAPNLDRLGTALSGYHFAKIGLARARELADWRMLWRQLLERLPPQMIPVGVVYVDWESCGAPAPADVLATAADMNCGALLFDTFNKAGGDLFRWMRDAELALWVDRVHRHEMLAALAGSITLESLERALALQPDVIGVRGAACRGGRDQALCRKRAAELCLRLSAEQTPPMFQTNESG